jgi:phosphopantetheinyl transferase
LLDATGQLVGFWTAENFRTGFHVFPFRVERVEFYGVNLPPGERVRCQVRAVLQGESQVRSDIDLLDPAGRLHTRLTGWWDRRFELPERFFRLRIAPRQTWLSAECDVPIPRGQEAEGLCCCLLHDLTPEFLDAHGKIWQRVLAHLILSRRERQFWQSLPGTDRRRSEWLLGRAAAKDAVRRFLHRQHGLEVGPADVEIEPDDQGRPWARGYWSDRVPSPLLVSLSHAQGIAVALAGQHGRCEGIGIDLEPLAGTREGFEAAAFAPEERRLLAALADESARAEWRIRLWCAKEAVAKALGCGLPEGPGALEVREFEVAGGAVKLAPAAGLAEKCRLPMTELLMAHTTCIDHLVLATALLPTAVECSAGGASGPTAESVPRHLEPSP